MPGDVWCNDIISPRLLRRHAEGKVMERINRADLLYPSVGRGREISERCIRNIVVNVNNRDYMVGACSELAEGQ